jgi:chaperonin cofactor prefoldin
MAKVDVTSDDLQEICTFNRLLHERNELSARIAVEESELQGLDDAEEELMLGLGDDMENPETDASEERGAEDTPSDSLATAELRVGSAFFRVPQTFVEHQLTIWRSRLNDSLETHREQRASVIRTMSELKKRLYGKFGSAINLEES